MSDEYPKDPLVLAATRALNLGHARPDIQANLMTRMHCNELQAKEAIEQAVAGIAARRSAEKKATRTTGLWLLALGAIILGLALYLGAGGVPDGRIGRLVIAYIVSSGATVVGIWLLIKGS